MTEIAASAPPRSRSFVAAFVAALVAACAIVPYALVGLGLRLVMAREFFWDGQSKIDGLILRINPNIGGLGEFTVILPTRIKEATLQMFAAKYAALPIPTEVTATIFSYAEFLLPVCLVLGFATRFSALLLLIMTVLMVVYATPETLWATQIYWLSILMVLLSVGPGAISIDALIRYLYRREEPVEFH